jgi:hypothetical protein
MYVCIDDFAASVFFLMYPLLYLVLRNKVMPNLVTYNMRTGVHHETQGKRLNMDRASALLRT